MIKAIIFDLDNCLAAAKAVGEELFDPAFEAIREANHGKLSEEELEKAFAEVWRKPLDRVAENHGFSKAMLDAGWAVFVRMEVQQPMSGYDDLVVLGDLPVRRFLVTSGFRRLQESKVRTLGLERWFEGMQVDAIDEPGRKGKKGLFEQILREHRLTPEEVLVVGDSPDSELEAGQQLGIQTVQTLREGVARAESATFHIRGLLELKELLEKAG